MDEESLKEEIINYWMHHSLASPDENTDELMERIAREHDVPKTIVEQTIAEWEARGAD